VGGDEHTESRDARVEEIRSKIERGEEPTPEEKEYLRSEGVELPAGEGTAPPAV
jgi:hypothetical protein